MVVESRKCVVHLLNGNKMEIHLQPKLTSRDLMDIVSSHFSLKEKEYFGLCYFDNRDSKCWLRPEKKAVDHNFQKANPIHLYFAVRLFIPSVSYLKENVTVELFYLHARQMIFKGEIACDSETSFLLAAYVLQATHGDYVSDSIGLEDLKSKEVLPVKTLEDHPTQAYREQKILDDYQKLDGIGKQDAIQSYMGIIERLPMYGTHYFNVKDKSQVCWKLGLNSQGITMYDYHNKTVAKKTYQWTQMENMYYRDKKFSMEYSETQRNGGRSLVKKTANNGLNRINSLRRSMSQKVKLYSYYCSSASSCRELWYMAVSYHKFHLEKKTPNNKTNDHLSPPTSNPPSKVLSRSSSFSSMRSMNSGKDNNSDSASFYFSLDGESISSSQIIRAEEDMVSALTQRKAFLEQQLLIKKELLNEICLRESELTGVIPKEIPDSPTHPGLPMRRRVGTSFEFDDSILQPGGNVEDHELDVLQRDYEIQKQITNAAQRLARDPLAKKPVRKKREASYQKSLVKLKTMEQQLEYLKRETARETFEGLTKLTRKEEAGSQGDSLGPIDVETSSSKSQDSLHEIPVIRRAPSTSASTRKPRESMYLASPVVNSAQINTTLNTITLLNNHDKTTVKSPPQTSVVSPRYDADTDSYLEYTDNFDQDDDSPAMSRFSSLRQSARTNVRGINRPTVVKIKSHFNYSAGRINELLPKENKVGQGKYLCDEFDNTGIYTHHVNKEEFSSNPAIPNAFSTPFLPQQLEMSPRTMRRLEQLSVSPKKGYMSPRNGYTNNHQSFSSLTSSDEHSEGFWESQLAEETLV